MPLRSLIIITLAFVFAATDPLLAAMAAPLVAHAADTGSARSPVAQQAVPAPTPQPTQPPISSATHGLLLVADDKKRTKKTTPGKSAGRTTKKPATSGASWTTSGGKAPASAWQAEHKGKGKDEICYAVSFPRHKQGKYKNRNATYLVVANRPGERVFNEISVEAGFNYRPNSVVAARIDGKQTYKLFTRGGNAWPVNPAADKALINAMKKGRTLVLKGTSSRGTAVADTYSLTGFASALATIDKTCRR